MYSLKYKHTKLCKNHEIFTFASFFVPLQVGMKNLLTSLSALLLVVWYSLSIIGFDVHTCTASGEVYIATVASGFTCEDIHPASHRTASGSGHSGCSCCHCHKEDASRVASESCCSDEYHAIVLTGVRGSQGADEDLLLQSPVAMLQIDCSDNISSHIFNNGLRAFYKPGTGGLTPHDIQAVYNIWRI